MRELEKLFSIRAWLICGFFAGLVAAIASEISASFSGPIFVIAYVVILGGYVFFTPNTAAVCPYCRKRVKFGATHCHHCGQYVGS